MYQYKSIAKNKITKQIGWSWISQITLGICSIIVIPKVIVGIGINNYALYASQNALSVIFSLFIDFGISNIIARTHALETNDKRKNEIVGVYISSKIFMALIFYMPMYLVMQYLPSEKPTHYLTMIMLFGCVSQALSPSWLYSNNNEVNLYSKIQLIIVIIITSFIIYKVQDENDLNIYATLIFTQHFLITLFGWILQAHRNKIKFPLSLKSYKIIAKASTKQFGSSLALYFSTTVYVIIVEKYCSTLETAVFTLLEKLKQTMLLPITSISPVLFKYYVNRNIQVIRRIREFLILISILVIIMWLAVGPEAIKWLGHEKLNLGIEFINTYVILFSLGVYKIRTGYLGVVALGYDSYQLIIQILFGVIGVILGIYFAKSYGILGILYVFIATEFLQCLFFDLKIRLQKN